MHSKNSEVNKLLKFVKALNKNWEEKRKVVIATIINTVGSTYRQTGAKSIFYEDGSYEGVLSGGCVEGDIYAHCQDVFQTGEPKHIFYNLEDDDPIFGFGVGCDGGMEIFLQIFDPITQSEEAKNLLDIYSFSLNSPTEYCVLTILESEDEAYFSPGELNLLNNDAVRIIQSKNNEKFLVTNIEGEFCHNNILTFYAEAEHFEKLIEVNCFVEIIKPISQLIILGAGHDAIPLADQAKNLNWYVKVVDHRPGYIEGNYFSNADQRFLYSNKNDLEKISFEGDVAVVVMSHHFEKDKMYLEHLFKHNINYLGILGSRKRTEKLLNALNFSEKRDDIHYPVGLDIGAEGPEEIALSILAEILKVKNGKTATSLLNKVGAIHT